MKPLFLFALAASLAFGAGCGDGSTSSANGSNTNVPAETSSSGGILTAPVDYLAAAGKAQQNALKTIDTTSINQAVQLFHAEHGRYPTDLNELVKSKHLAQLPPVPYGHKINYDPATGQATVVKQ